MYIVLVSIYFSVVCQEVVYIILFKKQLLTKQYVERKKIKDILYTLHIFRNIQNRFHD